MKDRRELEAGYAAFVVGAKGVYVVCGRRKFNTPAVLEQGRVKDQKRTFGSEL